MPKVDAPRRYDAQASRRALLEAARALFEERGYDRATLRDIGERAGVDAALVARYFGGKEGLYLATIAQAEPEPVCGAESADPLEVATLLLQRWEARGPSPISRALVSPALGDDLRAQVRDLVRDRLLEPLAAEFGRRGATDGRLRADLLVAVVTGIALTRDSGILETLAAADRADVLAVLEPLLDALG